MKNNRSDKVDFDDDAWNVAPKKISSSGLKMNFNLKMFYKENKKSALSPDDQPVVKIMAAVLDVAKLQNRNDILDCSVVCKSTDGKHYLVDIQIPIDKVKAFSEEDNVLFLEGCEQVGIMRSFKK